MRIIAAVATALALDLDANVSTLAKDQVDDVPESEDFFAQEGDNEDPFSMTQEELQIQAAIP
jgi:hypothetical protein